MTTTLQENVKFIVLTNLLVKSYIQSLLMHIQQDRQCKIISRIFLKYLSLTEKTYFLIHNTTLDTKARVFQYKVSHNILFTKKWFSNLEKKLLHYILYANCTMKPVHHTVHLFHDSLIDKNIWNQLKSILLNNISFPLSAPQCAIE